MIFQDLLDLDTNQPFRAFFSEFVQGFHKDFIRQAIEKRKATPELKPTLEERKEFKDWATFADFAQQLVLLPTFHPFILNVDQAIEFMHAKFAEEDLNYFFEMNMPFESIFIDFNGTLHLDGEELKGIMIERTKVPTVNGLTDQIKDLRKFSVFGVTKRMMQLFAEAEKEVIINEERVARFTDLFAEKLARMNHNLPGVSIMFGDEKSFEWKAIGEQDEFTEEVLSISNGLRKLAIGFCLFANSINVEVIKVKATQTKKRSSQGKPIPSPWYWCKLETKEVHLSDSEPHEGSRHGFQYDVRGHFKHFKTGRMTGKVLWCPPHRRGLQNAIYRPKTYNLTREKVLTESL